MGHLRDKVSIEHEKEIIHNLSNCRTFNDLQWPLIQHSRSRHFLKSNTRKTAHLKDKVTITHEETIPIVRNGTVFGDLDW